MGAHARRLLVAAVAMTLYAAGCTLPPDPPKPAPPSTEATAASLAVAVMKGTPAETVEAVQIVLARAGLPTAGSPHAAVNPVASGHVDVPDLVRLALDVRQGASGGLTVSKVAQVLQSFGWQFKDQPSRDEQVKTLLTAWAANQGGTEDPLTFGGAFLNEMAKQRGLPAGLEDPGWDPAAVRLSLLELLVWTSSFDRVDNARAATASPSAPAGGPSTGPSAEPRKAVRPLFAPDPCAEFRKSLGSAGPFAHVGANELRRRLVRAAMKDAPNGSRFGDTLTALRMLDRLARLLLLYRSAAISIEALSEDPIHKPVEERKFVGFRATAGISDDAWREYTMGRSQQELDYSEAVRGCMDQLGLPAPPSVGTIAAAISGWSVEWAVIEGSPRLATINASDSDFDYPGQFQHKLHPTSENQGQTPVMVMDLDQETQATHDHGLAGSGQLTVQAQLETSAPPSLKTFTDGARGGLNLAASVVELLGGFYQEMRQPTAVYRLQVTYHVPKIRRFHAVISGGWRIGSKREDGDFEGTLIIDPSRPAGPAYGPVSGRYRHRESSGFTVLCYTKAAQFDAVAPLEDGSPEASAPPLNDNGRSLSRLRIDIPREACPWVPGLWPLESYRAIHLPERVGDTTTTWSPGNVSALKLTLLPD